MVAFHFDTCRFHDTHLSYGIIFKRGWFLLPHFKYYAYFGIFHLFYVIPWDSTFLTFTYYQNSSNSGVAKPASPSSLTNIMERSQHAHHHASTHQRHHNMNRALLSKGPRHYYNIQHSQRHDPNHGGTSTSHGNSIVRDDRHSWKFGHRHESGFGYNAGDPCSFFSLYSLHLHKWDLQFDFCGKINWCSLWACHSLASSLLASVI